MKRIFATLAIVIAIGVFVTLVPPSKLIHAQESESKQPFETAMSGTWVVATGLHSQGIPLKNPKIVHVAGEPFLVGITRSKFLTYQDTPFSGGLCFVPLRRVGSIQQIPDQNQ